MFRACCGAALVLVLVGVGPWMGVCAYVVAFHSFGLFYFLVSTKCCGRRARCVSYSFVCVVVGKNMKYQKYER